MSVDNQHLVSKHMLYLTEPTETSLSLPLFVYATAGPSSIEMINKDIKDLQNNVTDQTNAERQGEGIR